MRLAQARIAAVSLVSGGVLALGVVLSSAQFVLQLYEMGVRRMYPEASDREVLLRVAARHLPRELMIRAYGWDPENDVQPG